MRASRWSMFVILVILVVLPVTESQGKKEPIAKTFEVEKGGNLIVDIEGVGADVNVNVWNKLEVTVRAERIPDSDLEYLEIDSDGKTVRVELDARDSWRSSRSARFYINVPAVFDLDISTPGGNIDVVGALEGEVVANSAGGNIELDDVKGDVELRTAGGNLVLGGVEGDARLSTAGGNVRVGDVKGSLAAASAGGNITVGDVSDDLKAATAGGNIRCGDVGGEADVETAGGNVELGVAKGGVSAKTAGGDIELEGAVGMTVAKTAGGDIDLSNVVGVVRAATAGGDITVELNPTNDARSEIETKGGDITLYLPADAKVTVEAQIRIRDWDRYGGDDYEIDSDFEAEESERNSREVWARFVINGGGKVVSVETVNGNIDIRKK